MKMYQVYVCDKCGFESRDQEVVELCEAKHIGLNSVEDLHAYHALKSLVFYFGSKCSRSNNEQTRAAFNHATEKLVEFEQKHGVIG